MHSFTFNGHSSEEFGIRIERFPNLNRSERKYKSASVAGRNGNIYQMQNAWEEVVVSYQIFAGELAAGAAVTDFTDIVEWLNSADDYAVLTDTYDPTHYRMAVFVDELEIESQWHTFGKATVRFRCRPQRYLVQNPISVSDGDTVTNTTKHTALPIITLTGSGARSLLDIDKGYINWNISAWGWHAGLNDYLSGADLLVNSSVPSGYIALYEQSYYESHGGSITTHNNTTGTITFTPGISGSRIWGVGTGLAVSPNTTYTISCTTTSGDSKITAAMYSNSGPRYIESVADNSRSGAGTLTLTFTTPSDCGNVFFLFDRPDGTAGTFSSIMLSVGSTAKPFRPYVADTTQTITVGDTSLNFQANGFNTAEIDCERENFSVDGADSNANVTVVDAYGNPSVDYLRLLQGSNTINFTGDITSVSVVTREWDL